MKKTLAITLALVMLLAVCATAYADEEKLTIAFCVPNTSDSFYVAMMNGVTEKCEELGITPVIQGPTSYDYTLQTTVLEAMMLQGDIDGLLIGPAGSDNMLEPMRKVAEEYNIPIVTLDISVSDKDLTLGHISSDNYEGGVKAAIAMDELIKKSGTESKEVALIGSSPSSDTQIKRSTGWRDKMMELGYTVVSEQWCKGDSSLAASQTQNILLVFPDVAGIFGTNLYCAQGIDNGLKSADSNAVIVTFDAAAGQVEGLANGTLDATVVQKPRLIGQMGVETLYSYLTAGEKPQEHDMLLEPIIAYQSDVDNPEINQWFYNVGN